MNDYITITFMIKINNLVIVVISLSVFAFIAYNVMTVQATTDPDKERKELCKAYDGVWNTGGECKIKDDKTGKKTADFEHDLELRGLYDDYTAEEDASYNQEKEKAAKEDALCDDEDADTTNVKSCMSDEREEEQAEFQKQAEYQQQKYDNLNRVYSEEEMSKIRSEVNKIIDTQTQDQEQETNEVEVSETDSSEVNTKEEPENESNEENIAESNEEADESNDEEEQQQEEDSGEEEESDDNSGDEEESNE